MEHQLWLEILFVLRQVLKSPRRTREHFGCEDIVLVWFWAVVHDRPVSWATKKCNWPLHQSRRRLPSNSTMSRRLRSSEVRRVIRAIEDRVLRSSELPPVVWMVDGKPLTVGNCSKDRQAGYGRAGHGNAKGYKLHMIRGADRSIAAWRIAPMNKDERVMARRLVKAARIQGYLLGDGGYDSNPLHQVCEEAKDLQLVAPPRGGCGLTKRRKAQSSGRRRAIALLENPLSTFGIQLLQQRDDIEREFGNLTNWGGGLTHLPPWVRTHRRVHRWVQAKLILTALKHAQHQSTYVTK